MSYQGLAKIVSSRNLNLKIALNFCFICLVWGSTFLAAKHAVAAVPPFVVTTIRYLLASFILFGVSRFRNEPWLNATNICRAAISGLMLAFANALVGYSVATLPTGLVAVVIGSLPAWVILLDWQFFAGKSPLKGQILGIAMALVGVAALSSSHSEHLDSRNLIVWFALFASILIWGLGSLIQRQSTSRESIFLFSAIQCATGGFLIGTTTVWDGSAFFDWTVISLISVLAIIYLLLATVTTSASYVWLCQNVEVRLVSTYALVSPVVAVWLGWLFAGESITNSTLLDSAFVLAGVAMILASGKTWVSKPLRARALYLTDSVVLKLRSQAEAG